MELKIKNITLLITTKNVVGRCYIGIDNESSFFGIHLFPIFDDIPSDQYNEEKWGLCKTWYDGPICSFGIGPFCMFVWRR